jgi:hypothetical protein
VATITPFHLSRIERLEAIARGLTREQISGMAGAVRTSEAASGSRPVEAYWLAGPTGVKLDAEEKAALARLWTRTLAGLAFAVSGEEVEEWVARPTLMGRLDMLVQPRQSVRIEGRATAVIERTLGGGVWQGVVGIWNAFCAALLRERLEPTLRLDLERAWKSGVGIPLDI